jgi:hypothetical protein
MRRRVVEQLVDQRHEALAESDERVVPLSVPVGVCNEVSE